MTNRTRSVRKTSLSPRQIHAVSPITATNQEDEFLRRARQADAARQPATVPEMSAREQTIALANKFAAFAAAGLPHVDPTRLAPVATIAFHDPESGDLVGGVQLPEELADTLYLALDALRRAQEDAEPAEHSRTADTAPARPALSVVPGGVA